MLVTCGIPERDYSSPCSATNLHVTSIDFGLDIPRAIRLAAEDWQRARGTRNFPTLPQIDPTRFLPTLSGVIIAEVVPAPDLFFVHFSSQSLRLMDRDIEDFPLGAIPDAAVRDMLMDLHQVVRDAGLPILIQIAGIYQGTRRGHAFQLFLPIGEDDHFVTSIITVVHIDWDTSQPPPR